MELLWGLNSLTHQKCLGQYLARSKHSVNLHWILLLDLLPTTGLFEISRGRRGRLCLHGIAFHHRKDETEVYHLVTIKIEIKSNQTLADQFFNSLGCGEIWKLQRGPHLFQVTPVPILHRGCMPRPPVEASNHREYQTPCVLFFFPIYKYLW